MRGRRVLMSLLALALPLAALPLAASADVQATQQVRLEQEKPVSGRYQVAYTDYQGKATGLCGGSRVYGTYACEGHRVRRGTLATKLATYKLLENVRGYDYYLLDVDIANTKLSGTSKYGWAEVVVGTRSGELVDSTETTSKKASSADCTSLDLSLSSPWPVVSGSVGLGSVRLCDEAARWTRTSVSLKRSEFRANMLGETRHVSAQRWVKVRRGERPSFVITVKASRDTCTASRSGWCTDFVNGSSSTTYSIGTR